MRRKKHLGINLKIAILGTGMMGRWLARFAKENLGEVIVADINRRKAGRFAVELKVKSKHPLEAAAEADFVLVAVPISKTVEVVKAVAGVVKRGAMIADVSSVKEDVVAAMKEIGGEIELTSIHPLFGPGATTIEGKDFLIVPVRTGKLYRWLKRSLTKLGARVTELGAEEHDKLMAIIQCLTHFTLISYLTTLRSLRDFEKLREVRTPMFAFLMDLAKAVLACNPQVFGELQVHNRYARLIRSRVMESCRSLDTIFSAKDAKEMERIFEDMGSFLEPKSVRKAYASLYKRFEGGEA
jgi:prephenate dehydrogenase